MELDDLSLKATDRASPHNIPSSSSRKPQSMLGSRQDCNATNASSAKAETAEPQGSTQTERPTPSQPQHAASTQSFHPSRSKIQDVRHWWLHNIDLAVSHDFSGSSTGHDPRDHHALERTFLAYIRTSNAFVSLGVVIAQLFLLANVNRTTGIVFAALVLAIAILMTVLACGRFFYQQKLMMHGRIRAGGWDVTLIWVSTVGLCLGLLVAVLVST